MDILEELFFDPRQGFLSQERLYLKAKSIDKNITRKQVKEFLENNLFPWLLILLIKTKTSLGGSIA
jgi:hypothetical protein